MRGAGQPGWGLVNSVYSAGLAEQPLPWAWPRCGEPPLLPGGQWAQELPPCRLHCGANTLVQTSIWLLGDADVLVKLLIARSMVGAAPQVPGWHPSSSTACWVQALGPHRPGSEPSSITVGGSAWPWGSYLTCNKPHFFTYELGTLVLVPKGY